MSTKPPLNCSIFLFTFFEGFLESGICARFTQAQSKYEWEGVYEEEDPEDNDLDEEPRGTVFLGSSAQLTPFAEVGLMHKRVRNDAVCDVSHGDVVENAQATAHAN